MPRDEYLKRIISCFVIVALMLWFFIYIGEHNGMSKCNHCGYTTYAFSKPGGCRVPGCDQKTPHKDQR